MTGILNHPKMPVVAGSLALALLAGGVYSSMEQSSPVATSVRKVDTAAKAVFASSAKAPTPAASKNSAPSAPPQLQAATPVSALTSAAVQVAPRSVELAVGPVQAVAPVSKPAPVAVADGHHEQAVNAVTVQPATTAQPAEKLIIQPIMPATAAAVTNASPASAPALTPVTVKPMPVVRVTVPDTPAAPVAPVVPVQAVTVVQQVKQVVTAESVHPVAHPAEVTVHEAPAHVAKTTQAPALKKKKKHHVMQQDDESEEAPVPDKPITVKTETIKADGGSDYTEIKGTATSEILTQPRAAAPVAQAAPAKSDANSGFRPNVVASSGGQAWVRISPERTIVVKAGDNVPGLGKVSAVTGSAVETDKGKFSVNSKE